MTETPAAGAVRDLVIDEEMKSCYLNYAMSVIVSRALPDARDGLKPSQRRILIAMNDLNLGPRSKFRKCAKIAGDTSGNYHPHGEQVVYPTLVRLAQPFNMRYPLIDGQGNFGSIDGDPPAAMRYTEARLTSLAMELLADLEYETVDFIPNYDDTRKEPTVLPSKFPTLLCCGSSGIAVGMATSIPPHNLTEITMGLIKLIENPRLANEELMEYVKGPDFPTGSMICGTKGIRDAYTTGRGLITVRAKLHTEEVKGGKTLIVVTEIPYQVQKTAIIEKIATLVKEDQISGIADLRDESDKEGIRLVIELKRGEEPEVTINQLYENTPLQDTFSIILLALVKNRPRLLTLKELMEVWIEHRVEVIRRRTHFLLERALEKEHLLEGLMIAIRSIDEVIATIKQSPDTPTASRELQRQFKLSERQAEAILQMRLARLTGLERDKLEEDLREVRERIKEYRSLLADRTLVMDIITEDLYELQEKHGDKRLTEIAGEVKDFSREDLIAEEQMVVTITHAGYVKRMPITAYRAQGRGGKGVAGTDVKQGDFVERLFTASTHDYLLFFTNLGKVYWQKVYDLPQLARNAMGRPIVNMLSLAQEERISSVINVSGPFDDREVIMATRQGTIKKTKLSSFNRPMRTGIIAIGLEEEDSLIGVELTDGRREVMLGTRHGQSIRFRESEVRSMGRQAAGVGGINLEPGDEVVDLLIVQENGCVLTACENGYGKRTVFSEYRLQGRNGSGIINIRTTERNGRVVGMKAVSEDDDVMLISTEGMVIRMAVRNISAFGRNTQGVRLISLSGTDRIACVARIAKENEEEEARTRGGPAPTGQAVAGDPAAGAAPVPVPPDDDPAETTTDPDSEDPAPEAETSDDAPPAGDPAASESEG